MKLEGRVAIVTGAARGIGEAIAIRFAADGARVVVNDVDDIGGRAVCELIRAAGGQSVFHLGNVGREEDVVALTELARSRFGGVDVLVNNAGIVRFYDVETITLDAWNEIIAVNLTGPMLCIKHCVPAMKARGGSIINMSSIHATLSGPQMSAYAATKGALNAMTRSLALELGPHRIRVNAVLPGYIQTPLFLSDAERVTGGHPERFIAELEQKIRLRRLGEPDDVAGLCAFLASDDSSYVSGACLSVDGAVSVQL